MCQCFLCWLNSWILLLKERRHCLTGLNPGARCLSRAGDSCPPAATTCVTFAAEEKREGDVPPGSLWGQLLTRSTSRLTHRALSSCQCWYWARSSSTLRKRNPGLSTGGVSSCCSSRSQGAVVLWATFGKGCGRVTAVLASNSDQVKVVTLLHEYLSPRQRPWSFLLPRFSVPVTPQQLTITWEREELIRERDKPVWLQLMRERFGYEVLSAKALPLHFLNQLLILP